ncbi:hypothetical protein MSPP1_001598 [Malassezia sp. CBS 17886]|nr:hypothetical protein MSPP1_001598 [Malassezia sp. CBS 17886]
MLGLPGRLLFGDDSAKQAFLSSATAGIPRLYSERHIPAADHRYWVQYTTAFDSPEEVTASISVEQVRRAANDAPENVVTLIEVLCMHLESLVNDPLVAPVPPYNPGGLQALFAPTPARPADTRDRKREALNCSRVLTRVVPVVYETVPAARTTCDIPDLEHASLWGASLRPRSGAGPRAERANSTQSSTPLEAAVADDNFIIADADDTLTALETPETRASGGTSPASEQPSVGHSLLDTLIDLLFLSGFTLPWTEEQLGMSKSDDIGRVHFTIWEAGIGCPVDLEGTTTEHLQHRVEIMRLLLVLLSKPMYVAPDECGKVPLHALDHIACRLDKPIVLSFLCSMLNTLANYRQDTSWGLLSLAPSDARAQQLSLCVQLLVALLAHEPAAPDAPNLFLFYATKLYRTTDFAFLAVGAAKIFQAGLANASGPFELAAPSHMPEVHVSDMMSVLSMLIRSNAQFRAYIGQSKRLSVDLLSWLLHVALLNRTSTSTLGQVQQAVFLLQDLTADANFSTNLSAPGSGAHVSVPSRLLRLHGAVATDALIEAVYTLLTTSGGALASLNASLLLVLCNSAPFWRNLSVFSAQRLELLLVQITSLKFLLASEGNPRLCAILIDTLTRVVQWRLSENANVVFMLVRFAHVFDELATFSLEDALLLLARRMGGQFDRPLPPVPARTQPTERRASGGEDRAPAPRAQGDASQRTSTDAAAAAESCADVGAVHSDGVQDADAARMQADQVRELARAVGRNGFVPTQEWVDTWLPTVSGEVLRGALAQLVPRVRDYCADPSVAGHADANEKVFAFVREQTLESPAADDVPIRSHPYYWDEKSSVWLQSYLWGVAYLSAVSPLSIWTDTHTRLFEVHVADTSSGGGPYSLASISSTLWSNLPNVLGESLPSQETAEQGRSGRRAATAERPLPVRPSGSEDETGSQSRESEVMAGAKSSAQESFLGDAKPGESKDVPDDAAPSGPKDVFGDVKPSGPKDVADDAKPSGPKDVPDDAKPSGPKDPGDAKPSGPKDVPGDAKPSGPKDVADDAEPSEPKDVADDAEPSEPKDLSDAKPSGPKDVVDDAEPSEPKDVPDDAEPSEPKDLSDANPSGPKDVPGDAKPSGPNDVPDDAKPGQPKDVPGDAKPNEPTVLPQDAKQKNLEESPPDAESLSQRSATSGNVPSDARTTTTPANDGRSTAGDTE